MDRFIATVDKYLNLEVLGFALFFSIGAGGMVAWVRQLPRNRALQVIVAGIILTSATTAFFTRYFGEWGPVLGPAFGIPSGILALPILKLLMGVGDGVETKGPHLAEKGFELLPGSRKKDGE
ncbi:MAG: hypothetical protein ACOY4R_27670 [Pseudomonadota bacterium]